MKYTGSANATLKLPALIRTTLEERCNYHQRFFYTFLFITCVLVLLFVYMIWSLRHEHLEVQLPLGMIGLVLLGIFGYLVFHHNKRKRILDDCLHRGKFSVIKGTLDGIQPLRWQRVRYVIDGYGIDGVLVFPGFTAFQNTRVIDTITTYDRAIELYLLPNGLIAGAYYPDLDREPGTRPASAEDWKSIAQSLRGGLLVFVGVSAFISLIVVAISWYLERENGNGWEMLGMQLLVVNGAVLSLLVVHLLINWPAVRALFDKYHPSVHVQVYQGLSAEWYLTGTRYGGTASTTFNGWIRLSGSLHQIQFDNLFSSGNDVLEPLKTPTQLEYLVHNDRMIFLRSSVENNKTP